MSLTEETRKKIFDKLKKHLKKCSPPMVDTTKEGSNSYELNGNKPVPYGYKKQEIPGMHFASITHRKNSVVLYFFPSYYDTTLKATAPSLYKCLKGKTCFHFTKEEQVNEQELSTLLKKGMDAWKLAGYLI